MRERPASLKDDIIWLEFEKIADAEGYGDYTEDWMPWFDAYLAGVVVGLKMSNANFEKMLP